LEDNGQIQDIQSKYKRKEAKILRRKKKNERRKLKKEK